MAGVSAHDLERMQAAASSLWGPARRWTPGEIAWAVVTGPGDDEVRFVGDGFAWKQEDYLAVLATEPEAIADALASAGDGPVQLAEGDRLLASALDAAGYTEALHQPFEIDLRLETGSAGSAVVPSGFRVRRAGEGDDLVAVHQVAWRPADLPFASGLRPAFAPEATSGFTSEVMARVAANPLYRQDLHVVVEAPDGSLAGSCIAWLDRRTGVAAIEPLGVVPRHRGLGLAGALCLHAARLVHGSGGTEVVIHPRGDAAYPPARAAYLRAGFRPVGRTRILERR
jgi:GNAT superfamily N-acetyltransferase